MIFVSNDFIWRWEFHIRLFFTSKSLWKNISKLGWFRFLELFFRFFDVMDRFIMVSTVFYIFLGQNELKNRFLDKKHKSRFFNHHGAKNLGKSNKKIKGQSHWPWQNRPGGLTWLVIPNNACFLLFSNSFFKFIILFFSLNFFNLYLN